MECVWFFPRAETISVLGVFGGNLGTFLHHMFLPVLQQRRQLATSR
jgi:nitrate/nitrite transporter NarK